MLKFLPTLTIFLFIIPGLNAQTIGYFQPDNVTYNPDIPTPVSVIGHELGEQPVRHDIMVQYLREIAELSDRLTIETIGYSYEGRPIEFLVATSPDNHDRMDQIRETHLQIADPENDIEITEDMPVMTWLNFGVHGAEAAAMDTAIPVVYYLAAAEGEYIDRVLDESMILITAVLNPDGHAKRITNNLKFKSNAPVTSPDHAGHDLFALQRANHYWFDLNRQWLLVTQPESKIWVQNWHKWKPHLSADFHEMGTTSARPATYHFSPAIPTRMSPLIPQEGLELVDRAAEFHSNAHDKEARLYFVEESFPGYYIGTGSTYPQVNGSLGILFEVGTAAGGKLEADIGTRTYPDNIRLHFTSALSTIEAAFSMREDLLNYRQSFFTDAPNLASDDSRSAYIFSSPDRSRLAHFVELMEMHDVKTYNLNRDIQTDGMLYSAEESYIIPLEQGQYRLIRGIFDRVREFEEPIFYDASGWTLPLSYNLDYSSLDGGAYSSNLFGDPATARFPEADLPDRSGYGYLFSWTDYYAPAALYRLMNSGILTRASLKPFTLRATTGEVNLDRGSIFIPFEGQRLSEDEIYEAVSDITRDFGIEVHAATSGRTVTEGSDLGAGRSFNTLEKPTVLLLFDDGIQTFDAGHMWHLLDYRMEIPVTMKQKDRIMEIDWKNYTHIIIPGGRDVALSSVATERLRQWIREDGGTLIGLRQAAEWAEKTIIGRSSDAETPGFEPGSRFNYEERELREAEDAIGGAIFASDLDITHPLGFGYHNRFLPSHRDTPVILKTPENPFATVARYYEDGAALSGYVSERRENQISGTPMMVAERMGSGTVILMTDNPNFRGTYLGTNKLFLNTLFFSKMFSTPRDPDQSSFRR